MRKKTHVNEERAPSMRKPKPVLWGCDQNPQSSPSPCQLIHSQMRLLTAYTHKQLSASSFGYLPPPFLCVSVPFSSSTAQCTWVMMHFLHQPASIHSFTSASNVLSFWLLRRGVPSLIRGCGRPWQWGAFMLCPPCHKPGRQQAVNSCWWIAFSFAPFPLKYMQSANFPAISSG